MTLSPAMAPSPALGAPLSSGAPPGAPPPEQRFHSALAEEWARTAPAEGQNKQSPQAEGVDGSKHEREPRREEAASSSAAETAPALLGAGVQAAAVDVRTHRAATAASARVGTDTAADAHVKAGAGAGAGAVASTHSGGSPANSAQLSPAVSGAETPGPEGDRAAGASAQDGGPPLPAATRPSLGAQAADAVSQSHSGQPATEGAAAVLDPGKDTRAPAASATAAAKTSSASVAAHRPADEAPGRSSAVQATDARAGAGSGGLASTEARAGDGEAQGAQGEQRAVLQAAARARATAQAPAPDEASASSEASAAKSATAPTGASSPRAVLGGSTRAHLSGRGAAGQTAVAAAATARGAAVQTTQPLQSAEAVSEASAAAEGGPVLDAGVDLQDMIDSIHATIELAARQGMGQARIALQPAELGQIRIHLSQTSEGLLARVTADTPAAAQALAAGRSELHHSLSSLGTSLLRLDIGSFNQPDGHQGHAAAGAGASRPTATTEDDASIEQVSELDGSSPAPRLPLGGLVDVLA